MDKRFEPIGRIRSDFREKFGTPRQPGLVAHARGVLPLEGPSMREAVRGLESFSHVWLVFLFHDQEPGAWKSLVRPPRLGGVQKMGVLASRSPHRPNPIGLSAVELERVVETPTGVELHLKGIDLVDGTPVLDVKPYLAYSDAIPDARAGWADSELERMPVRFSPRAEATLEKMGADATLARFREVISQMLELDPRPAHQRTDSGPYAAKVMGFDVRWRVADGENEVVEILELPETQGES